MLAACFALSVGPPAGPPPSRAASVADSVATGPGDPGAAGPSDSMAAGPAPSAPLEPPPRRFWVPRSGEGTLLDPDRRMHAAATFNIALDLRLAGASPAASLMGAATAGVLKELHDSLLRPAGAGQGASRLDLASDAVGLAVAALVLHLVTR